MLNPNSNSFSILSVCYTGLDTSCDVIMKVPLIVDIRMSEPGLSIHLDYRIGIDTFDLTNFFRLDVGCWVEISHPNLHPREHPQNISSGTKGGSEVATFIFFCWHIPAEFCIFRSHISAPIAIFRYTVSQDDFLQKIEDFAIKKVNFQSITIQIRSRL